MKFTIQINQKAAIDCGVDLDIVDLAIFELLKDFSVSKKCKKLMDGCGTVYFLFNWKLIHQQLPILGLNSRQAVYRRMEKLRKADVVVPNPDNGKLGQSWYFFGSNYDNLLFKKGDNNGLQGANENNSTDNNGFPFGDNNGLHNNSISNNSIKDTAPGKEEVIRKKKIQFLKDIVDFATTHPGKYPKLLYEEFAKYWLESSKSKKLRFENETYFEISRRLPTWFARCKTLTEFWEAEEKTSTINDLFKKLL